MNEVQRQVLEFHRVGGHVINEHPVVVDGRTRLLRQRLIREEVNELIDAMIAEDLEAIAKELADLLYVTYGTAISYGIDMEPVSAAVHASNMTKFGVAGEYAATCDATGKSIRDAGGKTLKPATYVAPDLEPILAAQGVDGKKQ